MERQAFRMPNYGIAKNRIVEITDCEDRGDFYYVSWRPVEWLDGKRINQDCGLFGAARIPKNKAKPERLPILVRETTRYGVGVRAGFTQRG